MDTSDDLYLKREWSLWFDSPEFHTSYNETIYPLSWKQNIKKIYTIDTIQNFWGVYNNIIDVENLHYKSAYYLFVNNTEPHCLDLNNQNGITIHFVINSSTTLNSSTNLNTAWLYTILSFVGENIKYSKYLNGVSIKKHKHYCEIVLWLKTNDEKINTYFVDHFAHLYKDKEVDLQNTYKLTFEEQLA